MCACTGNSHLQPGDLRSAGLVPLLLPVGEAVPRHAAGGPHCGGGGGLPGQGCHWPHTFQNTCTGECLAALLAEPGFRRGNEDSHGNENQK